MPKRTSTKKTVPSLLKDQSLESIAQLIKDKKGRAFERKERVGRREKYI